MFHQVDVQRNELARAIKIATAGVKGHHRAKLRVSLLDADLHFTGPGAATSIEAKGTWPAAVLVDAHALKRLAPKLPHTDQITMRAEDKGLHIGPTALSAEVLDVAPPPIMMPMGHSQADVSLAAERDGEPRVLATLGQAAVDRASEELDRRVGLAAELLSPYGVGLSELEKLVHTIISRGAASAPK